jgi:hypothetical protein
LEIVQQVIGDSIGDHRSDLLLGCCWSALEVNPDNLPSCFYPSSSAVVTGYRVSKWQTTPTGFFGELRLVHVIEDYLEVIFTFCRVQESMEPISHR